MSIELGDLDQNIKKAVRIFWRSRMLAAEKQKQTGAIDQGERAGVTAGKNMDGFVKLLVDLVAANGLTEAEIYVSAGVSTLPGYFRPTKNWDLLVIYQRALIAAVELKSQVGPSFGNNFNNRSEEAIGSAIDFWTALRDGAITGQQRPFLGWLILVEDTEKSRKPVAVKEPHFSVPAKLKNTSYLERYDYLCHKLMSENLYTKAAVVTSRREDGVNGEYGEMSQLTSMKEFAAAFAEHIAAEANAL